MIDPTRESSIIRYDRNKEELEEFLLFCIAVAGKNAVTTAKCLDKFLIPARDQNLSPFAFIRTYAHNDGFYQLAEDLKDCGFGCYTRRAEYFISAATSWLDLKTCNVDDLERIKGVGPKTARFFLLFSREDIQVAVLDVHILKYLQDLGYNVPSQTPVGKTYLQVEQIFLYEAAKQGLPLVNFDLGIWNEQRGTRF